MGKYISEINILHKQGDIKSNWIEINEIRNKPFVKIKELAIDANNPSITNANICKLIEIHDRQTKNFHDNDENKKAIS